MKDSDEYEDPKDAHKKFSDLKKKENYEKKKEEDSKPKPKEYRLKYCGEELSFCEGDSKGVLVTSSAKYPVFVRERVLKSEEWKTYEKQADKALESGKHAKGKAEDGIKIIKKLSGSQKGKDWKVDGKNLIMIELKVFGTLPGSGEEAWDWRVVGVRDDDQTCAFFLEGLDKAHTGTRFSDLCVKIEEGLEGELTLKPTKASAQKLESKSLDKIV